MKILLVEPNYKNKYPPMGLMKISTYHKNRGDQVIFYKGELSEDKLRGIERVYITSLFTFYFDKTVNTVKYYKNYFDDTQVYLGGIMVTIMPERVRNAVGNIHLLTGLLTDSQILGFNDRVNVDELPLDYSILDECEYKYPTEENYFAYTTRGCPNACPFCAVPVLEPDYVITNNIYSQIIEVNQKYGERRNLLLLDNNIFNLSVEQLRTLVDSLKQSGFTKTPTYVKETIYERVTMSFNYNLSNRVLDETEAFLIGFQKKVKDEELKGIFNKFVNGIQYAHDRKVYFYGNKKKILPIIQKYKSKNKLMRYVDFNQGLEAGRITPEKMEVLSELPLRPVRIAFDHYNAAFVQKYKEAIRISVACGIRNFSNYMLYNYDDKPEDLWERLKINIDLAKELNIDIFSFPMKYMPITEIDRRHIGQHWNHKYLSALQGILVVTKGVVADGEDFFYRAFGHNCEEFKKILIMPKDFVVYRSLYEKIGLTSQWESLYSALDNNQRKILLNKLNGKVEVDENDYQIKAILEFYTGSYRYEAIMKNEKYKSFFDIKAGTTN